MEFKKNDENKNYIEQQLAEEPHINVVSKEDFEKRVAQVFTLLWDKLSKSFGPGGAGAFLSIYPNYYNTKDGFSIMKNIAFDKKIDQVICDIVMNICSRLNFTVGDGTTTATIATKSIYDAYLTDEYKDYFENKNILPREILDRFEYIKNLLLDMITKKSIPIKNDDPTSLKKSIRDVVFISSNGNEEMTEMISSLYEKLMYPAITCKLSSTGVTSSSIVEGYKIDVCLTDKLYINNDDNTMKLHGSDIIIFDHKVTQDTYDKILKPLSTASYQRRRHLICIAPFYDETALGGVIRNDLTKQYSMQKDIALVLTVCTKPTGHAKVLLNDLAMLLNTPIITPQMEKDIIERCEKNNENILTIFDIDYRYIEGLIVFSPSPADHNTPVLTKFQSNTELYLPKNDNSYNLGYCDDVNMGLKESTFSGFYFNQDMYDTYLSVAKEELDEIQRKCEKLGTFSLELTQKQHRYYSLGLKTAVIEVGSTSEISQGYLKDMFDDSIKAAKSAFYNGIVLGCNVTTSQSIYELLNTTEDETDKMLLNMLLKGFMSVYSTVLSNIIPNCMIGLHTNINRISSDMNDVDLVYNDINIYLQSISRYKKTEIPRDYIQVLYDAGLKITRLTIHEIIGWISILTGTVFDVSTGVFSKDVINSAETDTEIIKAVIDLLALLITGNQLVLR